MTAESFAAMLDDWDDEDLITFAAQLGRFTDAFEKMTAQMVTDQAAKAPHGSVEGNR